MSIATLALILGIIGSISLFFEWNSVVLNPKLVFGPAKKLIESLIFQLPQPFGTLMEIYITFACIFVFFLSIVGMFLGFSGWRNLKSKTAFVAIILNIVNLIFSLLIAWLLIGLAKGL